jgi:hypothetical protein
VEVHWPLGAFEYFSLDSNGDVFISPNSEATLDVKLTMPIDKEDGDNVEFQLTP